jgi:hypothetical protein
VLQNRSLLAAAQTLLDAHPLYPIGLCALYLFYVQIRMEVKHVHFHIDKNMFPSTVNMTWQSNCPPSRPHYNLSINYEKMVTSAVMSGHLLRCRGRDRNGQLTHWMFMHHVIILRANFPERQGYGWWFGVQCRYHVMLNSNWICKIWYVHDSEVSYCGLLRYGTL